MSPKSQVTRTPKSESRVAASFSPPLYYLLLLSSTLSPIMAPKVRFLILTCPNPNQIHFSQRKQLDDSVPVATSSTRSTRASNKSTTAKNTAKESASSNTKKSTSKNSALSVTTLVLPESHICQSVRLSNYTIVTVEIDQTGWKQVSCISLQNMDRINIKHCNSLVHPAQ